MARLKPRFQKTQFDVTREQIEAVLEFVRRALLLQQRRLGLALDEVES